MPPLVLSALFDVSGAMDTTPAPINAKGMVGGAYDSQFEVFGFLRMRAGHFETVFVKDSIGATVSGINDSNVVTGYYLDSSCNSLGFIRVPFVTFSPCAGASRLPLAPPDRCE